MNALSAIDSLEGALSDSPTTIARDLRLNLKRLIEDSSLAREESMHTVLALATATNDERLKAYARDQLAQLGFDADQIREASESAAIMAMLNVYYRFRHMIDNDEEYRAAGLRMTALARPALGKERFEMLAFAVSVLNGCASCIRSHERALRDAGVSVDKIHDLARLAAVANGLRVLAYEIA